MTTNKVRRTVSPILASLVNKDEESYRLYRKIWLIDEGGRYHSPTEEDLGLYVRANEFESFDQKISIYSAEDGVETIKFRKR
jgi:hypothetical protein